MKLETGEQRRSMPPPAPKAAPARPAATTKRPRPSRRLVIALALVILAGFVLGLAVPIHP
jgi:hypothetical protein